jgi:hypothetical protein
MNLGHMLECKLCHNGYLTWKFVVGANYYVAEFLLIVRIMSLVLPAVMCSGCSWFECREVEENYISFSLKLPFYHRVITRSNHELHALKYCFLV